MAMQRTILRQTLGLLLLVSAVLSFVNEEHVVRIYHQGGEHGQQLLDTLFELGITSLEHPKRTERHVDAYVATEQLALLQKNSLRYSFLPHPAQQHQEELRKRSGSGSHYHSYEELTTFVSNI